MRAQRTGMTDSLRVKKGVQRKCTMYTSIDQGYAVKMREAPVSKPSRTTLSPARVLEAACAIVDSEGSDALTMRRLGADLGVVPMAVYNYYPDRESLLDAIAEHALGSIAARERRGGWRVRLDAMIRDLRDLAIQHPYLYAVALSRPNKPIAAMQLMFEAMDALREAGLSQPSAVRWYHTFVMLLQGFPSWRASLERYRAAPATPGEGQTLNRQQLKDLQSVHDASPSDQFDQSIKILLDHLDDR